MDKRLKFIMNGLDKNEPADLRTLDDIENHFEIILPKEYKEFMLTSNGAERVVVNNYYLNVVGDDFYFDIWSAEDIIEYNNVYEVNKFAPGLILFGSNGGTDAYAFDTRKENLPIVVVPFIPTMSLDGVYECKITFYDFMEYLLAGPNKGRVNAENDFDAGRTRRAIALYIDSIIIGMISTFIIIISVLITRNVSAVFAVFYILAIIVPMFYFAIMESSQWKATFGKKIMGICVVDMKGNRISFQNALLRAVLKFLTLNISIIYLLFSQKNQAIHDLVANTLVIRNYDKIASQPSEMEAEQSDEDESSNEWF